MLLDIEKEKFQNLLFASKGFDKRVFEKRNLKFTEELSFKNDLGFDSLDLVELLMHTELFFEIEISDNIAENITNLGEAYSAIYDALKRKEFTKDNLIYAWDKACKIKDLAQAHGRINAIKYQFQRNAWEIVSIKGKLRIQSTDNESKIMLWPFATIDKNDIIAFDITKDEYESLKALYFDGLSDQ